MLIINLFIIYLTKFNYSIEQYFHFIFKYSFNKNITLILSNSAYNYFFASNNSRLFFVIKSILIKC